MEVDVFFETKLVTYLYYGRLEEIDFLSRLYDLNTMESNDLRYSNAHDDIWQHTVNNDDYPHCWVFEDERFNLKDGPDEVYLDFLCEIFHPEVRIEKGYWKEYLAEINSLLKHDGYEIYPAEKISNRNVYSWRFFKPESDIFIPYSQRNKKAIKQKKIRFSISREARKQIYQVLLDFDTSFWTTDETGWQYKNSISNEVYNDIKKFYTPMRYNKSDQYIEATDFEDFILYTSPYSVIDAIEFYNKYSENTFQAQINSILRLNDIPLKLDEDKVESDIGSHLTKVSINLIGEAGLKELLQDANSYYESGDLKVSVEKLWDAFERLKTYYSPTLDKKKSVNRIIDDMSGGKEPFKKMFAKEFYELTAIGNDFRIRHHETTKIDIDDERHYDYFYKRCLSLITTATQYLDNRY